MEPEKQFILICAGAYLGFALNVIINTLTDENKPKDEKKEDGDGQTDTD